MDLEQGWAGLGWAAAGLGWAGLGWSRAGLVHVLPTPGWTIK